MQRLDDIKRLFSISNDAKREFIIVGLGVEGKFICDKLINAGFKVKCFADENLNCVAGNYSGVPAKTPMECEINSKDIVIVCIGNFVKLNDSEILKKSIIKNLSLKGNDIYLWDKFRYCRNLFLELCDKNNIDLKSEIIKIGDLKLPNYFNMGSEIADIFAQEARDLILPEYFNEFSAVNEGPYAEITVVPKGEYPPIIFDCGANMGIFSAVAASKGCDVYAFEPFPSCVDILEKVANIYPKVKICQKALSDETGEVLMTSSDSMDANTIVSGKNAQNAIKVKCQTVDDFVSESNIHRLDYIKADIEGAERKMLKGATHTLQTLKPDLSLCTYHCKDDPEVLEKLILKANKDYNVSHKYKKLFASVN